jgi:hypothetical protein
LLRPSSEVEAGAVLALAARDAAIVERRPATRWLDFTGNPVGPERPGLH